MVLGGVIMYAEKKISVFFCGKNNPVLNFHIHIRRTGQIHLHIFVAAQFLVHGEGCR